MRNYSTIPVLMLLSESLLLLPSFLTSISKGLVLVDAADWGCRSNEENATINKNEVEIDASASAASATDATRINSDSIEEITLSEKRFVLYNSRRLTGECLPICTAEAPTVEPTNAPTTKTPTRAPAEAPTVEPTNAPTTKTPTRAPTAAPTVEPTNAPTTKTPTRAPAAAPTVEPTNAPTTTPPATPPHAPQLDLT
jgi:hypothetical protein